MRQRVHDWRQVLPYLRTAPAFIEGQCRCRRRSKNPKCRVDARPGPLGCSIVAHAFLPRLATLSALPRDSTSGRTSDCRARLVSHWLGMRSRGDRRQPLLQGVKSCGVSSRPNVENRMAPRRYGVIRCGNLVEETLERRSPLSSSNPLFFPAFSAALLRLTSR